MYSKEDFSIIYWSGDMKNPAMAIETYKLDPESGNAKIGQILEFNHAIALNQKQTMCWVCPGEEDVYDVAMYKFKGNFSFSGLPKSFFTQYITKRLKIPLLQAGIFMVLHRTNF